jgi:hypothetical protein
VNRLARVDDTGGVGARNVFLELRHRCAASNKELSFIRPAASMERIDIKGLKLLSVLTKK